MRTPSGSEPTLRPQIEDLDALVAAGALARGRRRQNAKSACPDPLPPENPIASRNDPLDLRPAPNGVELLQLPAWQRLDWLWHGFSTRRAGFSRPYAKTDSQGDLNLGFTAEDDRATVVRNRQLLAEAITGNAATPLVTIRQIHSNRVLCANRASARLDPLAKADGLITNEPGVLLAVMTADCIPVLVADRRLRIVAAFHAGWRGTVGRIVQCGVGRMRLHFGSRPADLVAAIGPGIGACCYSVGEEVQAAFESQFHYACDLFTEAYDPDPVRRKYPMLFLNQRAPGHAPPMMSLRLDLVKANRRQLMDAGLKPDQIHSAGICTQCHSDRFFSHRAERGRTGRMMSVIGIRNASNR